MKEKRTIIREDTMNVRVASIDEYQFLICVKYNVWGANLGRLSKWKSGDFLMFIVDKKITALAEVIGEHFVSDDVLWDNGFYNHRIGLKFLYILDEKDRIIVNDEIKELFIKSWGKNYGVGILNKTLISGEIAKILVEMIQKQPNSLQYYMDNINNILDEINIQRENEYLMYKANKIENKERKFKDKTIEIS